MRKKLALFLTFLMLVCGCLACGNTPPSKNDTLVIPEGYAKITTGKKSGVNVFGASVEFDPHFFSANVVKSVSKEEDWSIVESRVAKMGIDRFRVMILPSWLEPLNDNDDADTIDWDNLTPDSYEMYSLYKVLDLAQANGIDVNLTLWGVENGVSLVDDAMTATVSSSGGHFLAKGNTSAHWIMGAVNVEEFAENFSIYVQHLQKKGYTCIKEVTPVNEPDGDYRIGDRVDFENYKNMCLALDARFKKDGIRDSVKFILSDNTDGRSYWLEKTMEELDEIADGYSSHTYRFGYETTNPTISAWELNNINYIRATGKPHVIGEFGSNETAGATRQRDVDSYDRGVLLARQLCNFYNVGAAGASYWVLCDEYYNKKNAYDELMMLGLWKNTKETYLVDKDYYDSVGEDYEVRPQYYAYSLFTKYVPKGAEVYPIVLDSEYWYVAGTAFKGTNGKWVYMFANGDSRDTDTLKFALHNGTAYGKFDRYVYREDALPTGDALIQSDGTVEVEGQVLPLELAPATVMVFVQQ